MDREFLRVVTYRAWRSIMRHLVGETLPQRAAILLVGLALLAVTYVYVHWFDRTSSTFSDELRAAGLAMLAYLLVGMLWFGVYTVFIAPFRLWKEEKERADQAEAALIPQSEAARILADCTAPDGTIDLPRLREEMDRITDPRREYLETWDELNAEDETARHSSV